VIGRQTAQSVILNDHWRNSMAVKRLLLYLNDCPLFTYGLLYVLVTFFFAMMYWLMPGQFYHSTAIYEPILKRDEELIYSGINKALVEQGRKNHAAESTSFDGVNFPIDGLRVLSVMYEKNKFIVRSMITNERVCSLVPCVIVSARSEQDLLDERSEEWAIIPAQFERRVDDVQRPDSEAINAGELIAGAMYSAPAPPPAPELRSGS